MRYPEQDRARVIHPPLVFRLMGFLIRSLPPAWRRGLSRSSVGRVAHEFLKGRSGGRRWVTIAAGLNRGKRLLLDLRIGEYVYYWGLHEPEVQALLPKIVLPGQVVYDVGANIGLVSIAVAQLVGPEGRVFAFEPLPDTADSVEAAALANGLNQITVVRRAVADYVGESVLGTLSSQCDGKGTVVPVTTLDTLVYSEGFPPPHLIKLDVEGAESRALSGMSRLAKDHKPTLLIEIHTGQAELVWDWLSAHGYRVLGYLGGTWIAPTHPFVGRCLAALRGDLAPLIATGPMEGA